ncbi:protein S100-A1-like [Protopterus annectens]|uniref:protein S100-A1-like n=1 Tax=Protopterus annectens TaxID=7888 RepID=UPI001CFA855D|nr:protein S100-A1-like [Protopterus annectens]XP_043935897.1 protein S100-A1-like [Protopterus annectens]XP_043935899.1 protein S100-A1-like [Protopterus annectens]
MPSKLEDCMQQLISIFHEYSGKEGDKYKLNKTELRDLINNELADYIEKRDCSMVERILNDLDNDCDGEVDFNEFVVLVAALTIACNEFFQGYQNKSE